MLEVLMSRLSSRCFKGWKLPCAIVLLNVVLTAWAEFTCIKCLLRLDLGLTSEEIVLIITLFLSLFYDQHWSICIIVCKNRLCSLTLLWFTNRYLFLHLYLKKMVLRFTFFLLELLCILLISGFCIKTICLSISMLHLSLSKGNITQISIVSTVWSFYR